MCVLSFISKCCVIFVEAWPVLTIKRGSGRSWMLASASRKGASIVRWCLHSLCKWPNAKNGACIAYANGKT